MRWRLALPIVGLLLFASISYQSVHCGVPGKCTPHRYVWWSSIVLDTDPLNRHTPPCVDGKGDCSWGPESIVVHSGWLPKLLMASALPAFLLGGLIVDDLGYHGVNQLWTFMSVTPLLIAAWYYFVGWLIDRWRGKRSAARA